MGITSKTRKMLWGKSGNRCAMPDCKKELVVNISEIDNHSIIGEECHIIAQSPDGPRGNKNFDIKIKTLNLNQSWEKIEKRLLELISNQGNCT